MIRPILRYGQAPLHQPAADVTTIDDDIQRLADDMIETMYAAPGVGLAATQIGEPHRVFLVDIASEDEPSDLRVFVNPEIVQKEGDQTWEEGCLSFPGVTEEVKRAAKLKVRAIDKEGKPFEVEADGLLAVAIQHEHDHLDGVLMIDHLGLLKKRIVNRKMQKEARGRAG